MWIWIVPSALFVLSAATAGWIALRKVPQLRVMETDSASGERAKRVKEAIILERFSRLGNEKLGRVGKAIVGAGTGTVKIGRRAVQRLYRLEQYYQKLGRTKAGAVAAIGPEAIKQMLEEAEGFAKAGETIQAEKKYIEVVSHNPKCAEAYEGLGNLYLDVKQYDQAREALAFALRLSPGDASVHVSLADIDVAEGKLQAALAHLRAAVEKRPNNPKYLDRYIDVSLNARERADAEKGIARLKAANPENQKIPAFEDRLAAVPAAKASQET